MRTLSINICAAFLLVALFTPVHSAEILVATWYGKLPTEIAFEKRLKELHPDAKFTYVDAAGKKTNLANEIRNIDPDKYDLFYSFGTTGTKLVQKFLKGKKPHVFNMVSAPVLSKIVSSMDAPGNNITGAQYLVNIELQLEVLAKLRDYKTLGVWFDPREKQSNLVMKKIKSIANKRGAKVMPFRIIGDSEKIDSLIDEASVASNKLDAIYLIGTSSFIKILKKMHAKLDKKLLVMATADLAVKAGSTVALAVDFSERGVAAAEQASRILKGEPAGKIPVSVVTAKNAVMYVNKNTATEVGLKDIEKLGLKIKYIQ